MSDKKISELNVATTPLAGTEVLPVVQSGTTKKVAANVFATAAQGTKADTALQNVAEDTSPQLGGDLGSNGNDVLFSENDKALFGSPIGLSIYSNGGVSYLIESGSGNLDIRATDILIKSSDNTKVTALFDSDGESSLYHNGAKKIATTATGVSVTGNVAVTGGNGIDFSADPNAGGMTSELLDDYEEGTFTASFNIGGTANATQTATYTKIGNIVYYSIYFFATGYTKSGTGDLTVSGLPFVSKTSFTCLGQLGYFEGYNSTTNGVPYVQLPGASQALGLYRQGANNFQTMTDALFATGTLLIRISGTYLTD